jgi:hypothetical protein
MPGHDPGPAGRRRHSIKKIVQTLRTACSATIEINGQRLTLGPGLTDAARDILKRLESGHLSDCHESGQTLPLSSSAVPDATFSPLSLRVIFRVLG